MQTSPSRRILFAVGLWSAMANVSYAQSYSGGSGTLADPYLIANKADLKYLSENSGEWSKHFRQTADIAFVSADFESGGDFYNGGEGWIPIGTGFDSFTGSYDGDGHTIDSLYINRSGSGIGMFSDVASASVPSITNLGLLNVTINSSGTGVGALAGSVFSTSSITYCYSTGTITVTEDNVGGLVGFLSSGTINNSYSECSVSSGGSSQFIGGLVGLANSTSAVVNNSYATGAVGGSGSGFVGGLIGVSFGYVYNSYSAGAVTGSATGFIYQIPSLNASGNFWDTETSGSEFSNGATGKTTAEMMAESTFVNAGWDTTNVWTITDGVYPTLKPYTFFVRSFSPLDDATVTNPYANLILTFSGAVTALSGKSVSIYDAGNGLVEQIPVDDAKVTIAAAAVTINPDTVLPNGLLHVLIDSGAFQDGDANVYGGISDTSTWSFTVNDPAPIIQTLSPADGDTAISGYVDLVLTFTETVTALANKYIALFNGSDELVEQISADDARISVSGAVVTIDLQSVLPDGDYYVQVDPGAFRDSSLREFAGIEDMVTWNFTVTHPELSVWGYSVEFGTGSSQYCKAGGVATTQTDNVTLEAWVKWDGTSTGSAQLMVSNGYSGSDGYGLYLYTDNKIGMLVSALAWHVSDSLLPTGIWTHLAIVRNGGTWSLYKDGAEISIGAPTTAPNTPATNLFIGGDSLGNHFHGEIDEVRISTSARYAGPFSRSFSPFTDDGNTAALYRFAYGGGSADQDASGSGNDLTLFNNPAWMINDYGDGPLTVTTDAASNITNVGGTLNGTVETYGVEAFTRFLFGTTSGVYTDSLAAVLDTVDADATTQISVPISGYVSGQAIYYRAVAENDRGEYVRGSEQSFTTSSTVWKNTVDFGESASQYAKAGSVVTSITDNLTLEAWVKWDGTNTGVAQVIATNGQAGGAGYGLYLYPDTRIAILLSAVGWFVSDSTLSTDVWTHLSVVRNNGTWSLYKDGHALSIGTATTSPNAPSGNFFVGGDSVNNYFHGEIDEVRMSDVVRYTESFDPNIGPLTTDANTLALYRFNEGTGTTVGDSSGVGNDLTLFNAPTWKASDNDIEPARAATYPATDVGVTSARLHGVANGYGETSDVRFLYGTESGVYSDSVDADPGSVSGIYGSTIDRYLTGLMSGTTYYYTAATAGESAYARGDEHNFWTISEIWWYALGFGNGSSQFAQAGDVVTTRTDSVTLEAWVKWDGVSTGSPQLIVSNGNAGSDGYGLYLFSDTKIGFLASAINWYVSDSVLTSGEWTHLALVRDGTWKLYKNGKSLSIGSPAINPITPSSDLYVGGDGGNFFYGQIDEVRVSTLVRYASDFSVDIGPFTSDMNTVALYHFDDGSGSSAADASAYGNDLTLVNGPAWKSSNNRHVSEAPSAVSDSVAGSALDFSGETSGHPSHYVEIPYAEELNPSDNFTAELWVRPEGGVGTYRSPLGCGQSSTPPQGYYFYAADNNKWQVGFGDSLLENYNIVDSDDSVIIDTWTHLAVTYASGTAKLYVNGVLKVTKTGIGFNPNRIGVTRIGDIAESPGFVPWNGKVDEVRLWSVARTAQQVREGMHRTIPSDAWGLVAYYQLNEGSGTTVDNVFGAYTGTITGSPAWVTSTVPVGGGSSGTATNVTTGAMNFGTFLLSMTNDFDEAVDLVGTQILAAPDATTGISGTVLSDRYWIINSFGNPGTFMANLTFTVPSSFTNGGSAEAAEYTLYHRSGNGEGTWTAMRSGATGLTTTTVSFDSVSSFSQFTIGTEDPLPVQMLAMSAIMGEHGVTLSWQTATEVDNAGWEVERREISNAERPTPNFQSVNSGWEKVGFVEGSGTSTSTKEYTFADNPPFPRTAYRLKQLDRSGGFKYTEAIEVVLVPTEYELYQNYPNPFNPATTIRYDLKQASTVTLEIYDLLGRRVVFEEKGLLAAGRYNEIKDLGRLSTGVYVYRILAVGVNGEQYSSVKRMVLLR